MSVSKVKEKSIRLRDFEVLPILNRTKTQIRKMIKSQPSSSFAWTAYNECRESAQFICPYGQPSERLWVQESMYHGDLNSFDNFYYSADRQGVGNDIYQKLMDRGWYDKRPIPSSQMPRWASRINLEIVSVRVERLKDISIDDCIAEGIKDDFHPDYQHGVYHQYSALWEFINGPGSWGINPWVWVIEFRRIP